MKQQVQYKSSVDHRVNLKYIVVYLMSLIQTHLNFQRIKAIHVYEHAKAFAGIIVFYII